MSNNRLGQLAALVCAILAAIVALAAGKPGVALDHVEAAIPAVQAVIIDTDTDTKDAP